MLIFFSSDQQVHDKKKDSSGELPPGWIKEIRSRRSGNKKDLVNT